MVAAADRVLIVEDEESSRILLAATLERAGYEAASVDSPDEALDLLARGEKVDLLLAAPGSLRDGPLQRVVRDYPATATVEIPPRLAPETAGVRSRSGGTTGPFPEVKFANDVLGRVETALAERQAPEAPE